MNGGEHSRVGQRVDAWIDQVSERSNMSRREFLLGLSVGALGIAQGGALAAYAKNLVCDNNDPIECHLEVAGLPKQEAVPPTTVSPDPEATPPAENVSDAEESQPVQEAINVENLPDLGVPWLPPTVRYWGNEIRAAAEAYHVDLQLGGIIVTLESGGWPEAISPSAEAQGLMQIWPPTGRSLASVLGLVEGQYNLLDPVTNTTFGMLKLRQLLDRYQPADETVPSDRTVQLVATGYNGGEGRANNLLSGLSIPRETRVYSNYAVEMWQQRNEHTSPAFERWQSPNHGNGITLINKAHEYFASQGILFG